jgi:hypothetical protein
VDLAADQASVLAVVRSRSTIYLRGDEASQLAVGPHLPRRCPKELDCRPTVRKAKYRYRARDVRWNYLNLEVSVSTLVSYGSRGVKIVAPDPSGAGGAALNSNFKAIDDVLGDLESAVVRTIGFALDNGGSPIPAGSYGYRQFETNGTIVGWTILADVSGSITVDVKKASYSGWPTTSSITASAPISLSSQRKNSDTAMTGWTTDVVQGDIFEFVVTGTPSNVTKIWVFLQIEM